MHVSAAFPPVPASATSRLKLWRVGPSDVCATATSSRSSIDRNALHGTVNLVGEGGRAFLGREGAPRLAARAPRPDLAPHPDLPDDTRLWAALVQASGGVWGAAFMMRRAIVAQLVEETPPIR